MAFHQALDLQYWFVNVFSEGASIFILVGLLLLSFISAKLKIPTGTFFILTLIFGGIVLTIGQNWILGLIIIIGGPLLFWTIRRVAE